MSTGKTERQLSGKISFASLTSSQWQDFEELFGKRGACGGCWCMWWRMKRSDYNKQKGEGNRKAMRQLIDSGNVPGIMVYSHGEPAGWISIAPRSEFSALERSRILKPVDDRPVWSIVCIFIKKGYRNMGLSGRLISHAVQYASENGAEIVEAYPVEPKKQRIPELFAFTGLASAFRKAGFQEVVRRSETRPVMRYFIKS